VNNKWTQQPTQEKTTGIGLKNLKTRLDLLYPNQYQLQIDDQESQYSVTLVIPFLG
jgi:LytS/YehU family sensor histidine kinase